MRKVLAILFITILVLGFFALKLGFLSTISSPTPKISPPGPKPFDKYTIEALSKTNFSPSQITIGKNLSQDDSFSSYVFYFNVEGKKISGVLNTPQKAGNYPVIVMFRGYVDRDKYFAGEETQPSAQVFAKNGFITVAPDFLGYGESDSPSSSSIEERFQTYTTAATILVSVKNLNSALGALVPNISAQTDKVGIWGHSNGGQIALTTLEITGVNYPTVLWAPVSRSFPYSVLYYTDEFDDQGKALRKVIADFEKDYDADKYSLTNFLDKIDAKIQLHQGTSDEEVPLKWSNDLKDKLTKLNKDVEYFTYEGADHNLRPVSNWDTAVERSLEFYKKNLNQ